MDVQLTWTDCDEAGDYVVPNVLSPRDIVSRPDNMDETVLHTHNLTSLFIYFVWLHLKLMEMIIIIMTSSLSGGTFYICIIRSHF